MFVVCSRYTDGITYFHLKKLPSCHNFLATLYSKILLQSHSAPTSWCQGKTILLYKKGDASLPKNFRPIMLTSVIGKLFHHNYIVTTLREVCFNEQIA